MRIVGRGERPARYPLDAVKRERPKAKRMDYTAANDFEHAMMMAADLRAEDKNSREAVLLECAAEAVRRSQKRVWLMTRAKPRNNPVRI